MFTKSLGKEFFKRHQKKLLWLLNAPVVRLWFRWVLAIHGKFSQVGKRKIVEIFPNSIVWNDDDSDDLVAEFRTHEKFSKRIYEAFFPLCLLFGYAEPHRVFSEDFFERHQELLIWLLNNKKTKRWFRWVLRINGDRSTIGDRDVQKIRPNAISWIEDGSKGIGGIEYRTHNKFSKRLYYAFRPLWWCFHVWDWLIADRFVPRLSFGFGLLTIFPYPADVLTGGVQTVDGWVLQLYGGGDGVSWSTIRSDAGNFSSTSDTWAGYIGYQCDQSGNDNLWTINGRSIFYFQTNHEIARSLYGTFSLYGQSPSPEDSGTISDPDINIYPATTASYSSLASSDYAQPSTTALCDTAIPLASWSVTGYNDFLLNKTGRDYIKQTVPTGFCVKDATHDAGNSSPSWEADGRRSMSGFYADQSGRTYCPKLVMYVNYVGEAVFEDDFDDDWIKPLWSGLVISNGSFVETGGVAVVTSGSGTCYGTEPTVRATAIPYGEYMIDFKFYLDSYSVGDSSGIRVFDLYDENTGRIMGSFTVLASNLHALIEYDTDTTTFNFVDTGVALSLGTWYKIRLYVKTSTAPGANNGVVTLYVNDMVTPAGTVTGIDNDTMTLKPRGHIGNVSTDGTSATMTMKFDNYKIWTPYWGTNDIGSQYLFFPDSSDSPPTITCDGAIGNGYDAGSGATWANIRSVIGSAAINDIVTTPNYAIAILADTVSDRYTSLVRSFFSFDTSQLGNTAYLKLADFVVYALGSASSFVNSFAIDLVSATPASNSSLVNNDFLQVGSTSLTGAPVTTANWPSGDWVFFNITTANFSVVNKLGVTKFALREANYDMTGTSPTWGSGLGMNYTMSFSEVGSRVQDPCLIVLYSAKSPFGGGRRRIGGWNTDFSQ
jgi:hypothetical protein